MKVRGLKPGVVTFTTMVKCYCQEGQIVAAKRLLVEMEEQGVGPNVRTGNTYLRGCLMIGEADEALAMLKRMRTRWGVEPDESTYEMVVALLCQALRLDEAWALVEEAGQAENLAANPALHVGLARAAVMLGDLDRCGKATQQAEQLLEESTTVREGAGEDGAAPLEASGGKRAWRDNDTRHASAVRFDEHRREETRRELQLVKGFERRLQVQGDSPQPHASSLLPAFRRLLSFPADSHQQKGDACERVVWAMRRFGLDGVFRGGAQEKKKGKKRKHGTEKESKQGEAVVSLETRRAELVEACRTFVDPMGKIRFMWLFGGDKTSGAGAGGGGKLPLKMEICSGAGEWAVTQAKRDTGKANWVCFLPSAFLLMILPSFGLPYFSAFCRSPPTPQRILLRLSSFFFIKAFFPSPLFLFLFFNFSCPLCCR
jgi:pentatricopeptide repeat protein